MEFNTKEIRHIHAFIVDDKDAKKAIDIENKRINFVVSSDVVDRSVEVVEAQAVFDAIHRKGEFTRNPICLACHMHRLDNGMPPAIGSWDTATAKLRKHHVEMTLQFDTEYDLGQKYWTVYKNRTMRAVSIGFRVLDYRVEERDGTRVYIITKIELLEISCVAVGCNQQALAKGMGVDWVGADTKQLMNLVDEKIEASKKEIIDRLEALGDELDEIKDMLIGESDGSEDPFAKPEAKEVSSVAGDDSDTGQALNRIEKMLSNFVKEQ